MNQSPESAQKRKHVRFEPGVSTAAKISLECSGHILELLALVTDESYGGCGSVCLSPNPIEVGLRCSITVGSQAALPAVVRWMKRLPQGIMRVGFEFVPLSSQL
jgi:hypothetical protein